MLIRILYFEQATIIAAVVCSLIVAGLLKGVIGVGMPVVALPLLSLFINIKSAAMLLSMPLIFSNVPQALEGGKTGRCLVQLMPVILGTIPGVFLGVGGGGVGVGEAYDIGAGGAGAGEGDARVGEARVGPGFSFGVAGDAVDLIDLEHDACAIAEFAEFVLGDKLLELIGGNAELLGGFIGRVEHLGHHAILQIYLLGLRTGDLPLSREP